VRSAMRRSQSLALPWTAASFGHRAVLVNFGSLSDVRFSGIDAPPPRLERQSPRGPPLERFIKFWCELWPAVRAIRNASCRNSARRFSPIVSPYLWVPLLSKEARLIEPRQVQVPFLGLGFAGGRQFAILSTKI